MVGIAGSHRTLTPHNDIVPEGEFAATGMAMTIDRFVAGSGDFRVRKGQW
jgi:hypothetical protein